MTSRGGVDHEEMDHLCFACDFSEQPGCIGCVRRYSGSRQSHLLRYPVFQNSFGIEPGFQSRQGEKEEGKAKKDDTKEKDKADKKVDDAIKKAWEEK